jgi:hypothetical protein
MCSLALIALAFVPTFAQSNIGSQADNGSQTNTRFFSDDAYARPRGQLIAAHAPMVMREFHPSAADLPAVRLPENFVVPDALRALVAQMVERSPTFRRQTRRLGNAPHVHVRVLGIRPSARGVARARTDISRTGFGGLQATVLIQRTEELPELIAHELEHVIEQMDGIDLRAQSMRAGTGVRACEDGSFETIRAERIGTMVAAEVRGRR